MYPFERFSEPAKHVLTLAQEEAERSGHSYIGTEHILLGLLREGDGVAARILAGFGLDVAQVRHRLETVIGRDKGCQIIPTSRVKSVIELSFEESRRLQSPTVRTGHILVGLLAEKESIGAHVLNDLGVTLEKARAAVEAASKEGDEEPASPLRSRSRAGRPEVAAHVKAALDHLSLDDELERLVNPRHTDHDRHAFLPKKIAQAVEAARAELRKALEELDPPGR